MTQTLPQITEVIHYDPAPDFPGTDWTPRPDPQSPDLVCVTGEYAALTDLFHPDDVEQEPADPAEATRQPAPVRARAARHRGKGRAPTPPWAWTVFGAGLCLLFEAATAAAFVAVLVVNGAIR